MDISTERISTAEVMRLYSISSRTTLNQWLEEANISSFKDGKHTYIHSYQLNALDELARKKKRPLNSVMRPESESIEQVVKMQPELQPIVSLSPQELLAIATEFESAPPLARFLAANLIFEYLAEKQIPLPANLLRTILGKKSLPSSKSFEWGNFSFTSIFGKKEWMINYR